MLIDTASIEDRILDTLKNDPTLSGYVKSFSCGDMNVSRKQFPFVALGNLPYREGELWAGEGTLVYSVNIYAGTRSLAPGVAYVGSETGKKGIAELCEDIKKVIRNNTFSDAFFFPIKDIEVEPCFGVDKGESIFLGRVAFEGTVWIEF